MRGVLARKDAMRDLTRERGVRSVLTSVLAREDLRSVLTREGEKYSYERG